MTDMRLSFTYATTCPLRIAVLDEDTELRQQILLPALHSAGFQAHGMASAKELYRTMLALRFDIVVLDAELSDEDGFRAAQHLRAMSDIGIVMFIGQDLRQAPIQAFKSGADFYLAKPADTDLLTAALHSLGRRLNCAPHAVADHAPAHGWRLEADGWRLSSPNGGVVALTPAEHYIVRVLAAENGRLVSRETLIEAIAHNTYDFDPHRLEMTIHRLRRKAFAITGETLPLRTVRGKGYLLNCNTLSLNASPT